MQDHNPDRRVVGRRRADGELEMRVRTLEEEMRLLRASTERNAESTAKVLEIITMAEGFFKVLGYLGSGAKWVGSIGVMVGTAYAAWKGWRQP